MRAARRSSYLCCGAGSVESFLGQDEHGALGRRGEGGRTDITDAGLAAALHRGSLLSTCAPLSTLQGGTLSASSSRGL